jgi:hypothetical protein
MWRHCRLPDDAWVDRRQGPEQLGVDSCRIDPGICQGAAHIRHERVGPAHINRGVAGQAQGRDRTGVEPSDGARVEHLLSRVRQFGDQIADFLCERLGFGVSRGVQPPDLAVAPTFRQGVQHGQHGCDAHAR